MYLVLNVTDMTEERRKEERGEGDRDCYLVYYIGDQERK